MVITEEFFGVTLKLFVRGIFLLGFISGRCDGRSNDGYSTMSDGIFDGIFPIAHRTFLLSYFRGCWLSEFFFVLKVCWHIMKRLSSWRRPLFSNDYYSMALSFLSKLNFWRRKLYKILLDSFLYLSWFTATINSTVCSSRLFSTDLERHQYELDLVNAMFFNCLCLSIFVENSRDYFPFLSTDCLQWSSIPMMLGSVFLDVAVIRHDRILRDQCVFP